MFEACGKISPDIRLYYRLLKWIRDYFFPCTVHNEMHQLTWQKLKYVTVLFI